MNVHPILDQDGVLWALEVDNAYVSPRTIAKELSAVDGVQELRLRALFGESPDVHLRFSFHGKEFIVWEPYGDSSRYWIGPNDVGSHTSIESIFQALQRHRPSFLRKLVGDVLTLRFLRWSR